MQRSFLVIPTIRPLFKPFFATNRVKFTFFPLFKSKNTKTRFKAVKKIFKPEPKFDVMIEAIQCFVSTTIGQEEFIFFCLRRGSMFKRFIDQISAIMIKLRKKNKNRTKKGGNCSHQISSRHLCFRIVVVDLIEHYSEIDLH